MQTKKKRTKNESKYCAGVRELASKERQQE